MAHFAEIDSNGVVARVVVVANHELLDENGNEVEEKGRQFCQKLFGGGTWVQTSYSGKFRKQFAAAGFSYDAAKDSFIAPQKFPSWALNVTTLEWEAPVPRPNDGNKYKWDEATKSWIVFSTNN